MKKQLLIMCIILINYHFQLFAQTHPKLFCSPSQLSSIQSRKSSGTPQEIWNNLITNCTWYSTKTSSWWSSLSNTLVRYHGQIAGQMSFAYWLDNSRTGFRTNAIDICLNKIVGHVTDPFTSENPQNTLEVPSAVFALSITYDFLYNSSLSSDEHENFKNNIYRMLIQLKDVLDLPVAQYGNNITANQAAALGIGSIILDGEYVDDLGENFSGESFITYAKNRVQSILENMITPDGCYYEGCSYAGFALEPIVAFLKAYKIRYNTDLFSQKLKMIPRWWACELVPVYDFRNNITFVNNINDSWYNQNITDQYNRPAEKQFSIFSIFASEFNDNLSAWLFNNFYSTYKNDPDGSLYGTVGMEDYFCSSIILPIINHNDGIAMTSPSDVFTNSYAKTFNCRGNISRSGWTANDILFSVVGGMPINNGHLSFHHNQKDHGSFTFYAYGNSYAVDCANAYQLTPDHNYILINDIGQAYHSNNLSYSYSTFEDTMYSACCDYINLNLKDTWDH